MEFKIVCLVHQSLASVALTHLSADIRLISEHDLLTGHWLFHGCAPASGTEVSLLWDHAYGTLCRLRYER